MTRAVARAIPDGYTAFRVGRAHAVALTSLAGAVREALAEGSLYAYAAAHPRARALTGRGIAYAVPLPDGATPVVVRHSRHGGLLAGITGDRFLPPTRAPRELEIALRLAAAGVRTPPVAAYAVYPAGVLFRRSDVATREIARGRDLAICFLGPLEPPARPALLAAVRTLLASLHRAGARHPDLNLKNVLLAPAAAAPAGGHDAYVLDVDRITFGTPHDPAIWATNLRRLRASARKWREQYGAAIDDAELDWPVPEVAR